MQVHGGAGISQEFPLAGMWAGLRTLRYADGPDEVHLQQQGRKEVGTEATWEILTDFFISSNDRNCSGSVLKRPKPSPVSCSKHTTYSRTFKCRKVSLIYKVNFIVHGWALLRTSR